MKQLRVIWAAIVISTFIYAFILYFLSREWPDPGSFDEAVRNQRTLVLYGLAVFTFVIASILPRLLSNKQLAWVPSLAMFEAPAIFGLLAAFLAQDWRLFIAPWVLSLIGFATRFPSESAGRA